MGQVDEEVVGTVVTRWFGVTVNQEAPSVEGFKGSRTTGTERSTDTHLDRPLTFAASTESEDRAGDVVMADGWVLDAFQRNPVFLWAHRQDQPPIGRVTHTWVEGKSLMATVEFAPTPFAQEVASLYRGGYLAGVSVGFRALEAERRKTPDGRPALLFRRQELLEISGAPVPLNAEALVQQSKAKEGETEYVTGAAPEPELSDFREATRLWHSLAKLALTD